MTSAAWMELWYGFRLYPESKTVKKCPSLTSMISNEAFTMTKVHQSPAVRQIL